jgi:hypothetical protein
MNVFLPARTNAKDFSLRLGRSALIHINSPLSKIGQHCRRTARQLNGNSSGVVVREASMDTWVTN